MDCPACQTQAVTDSVYCAQCGARMAYGTEGARAFLARPLGVSILAVLNVANGVVILVAAILIGAQGEAPAIAATLLPVAGFSLATGVGLWRLERWGRVCQIVESTVGLLAVPLGTLVSVLVLIYLTRPGLKILFSGKLPFALTPAEINEVHKVRSGSMAVVLVAAVLIGIVVTGVLAAVAIPLYANVQARARFAKAEADVRVVTSALALYAAHCGALPPVGGSDATCSGSPAGFAVGGAPPALTLAQTNVHGQLLGPLLPRIPVAPIGWRPYRYAVEGDRFRVCTSGDGRTVSSDGSDRCP